MTVQFKLSNKCIQNKSKNVWDGGLPPKEIKHSLDIEFAHCYKDHKTHPPHDQQVWWKVPNHEVLWARQRAVDGSCSRMKGQFPWS